MILARLRRREPLGRVTTRHDILFVAKAGHEEIVDHILRSHDQLHRLSDRNVQFVDLAAAVRMLDFPHPLFADDVDLGRVRPAVATCAKKTFAAQKKMPEKDQKRDRPSR